MTIREYLYLCWLSYLDMPALYQTLLKRGGRIPVAAFAESILRMDAAGALACRSLNDPARDAARFMKNSPCVITHYINQNADDGFAAYVVECGGEIVVAMRGSESVGECVPNNIDWADNICEPFAGSVQQKSIEKLIETLPNDVPVTFTGHSKGGHNAMLALAISSGENFRAIAFNGQGFSDDQLTDGMKKRLSEMAVNYVVASDLVGALLVHPEKRVYVKQAPNTNAHMPEAFSFDKSGRPIRDIRAPISLAAGAASRLAYAALGQNAKKSAADICRAILGQ